MYEKSNRGRKSKRKRKRMMRAKPTISKGTAQRIHAKNKFMSRVGIKLTPELRRELASKITTKEAELIRKQSNRISIYDVDHEIEGKKRTFRLVFDKMRRNIVTILNNLGDHEDVEYKINNEDDTHEVSKGEIENGKGDL